MNNTISSIEAVNDHIACEPFKGDVADVVNKGSGFNVMRGLTTLSALVVVFGNKDYPTGSTIYVRADLAKEPLAKAQYDVDGKKVIFVPIKEIRLLKRIINTYYPLSNGLPWRATIEEIE